MNVYHEPMFDIDKVCKLYSEKDGVPVKYVCTSATNEYADFAADVFYRETPHPEFGNRYFALFFRSTGPKEEQRQLLITNADKIEDLTFDMIYSKLDKQWHYSQHRHDFRPVPGEDLAIDGGRSYTKLSGNLGAELKSMKVKDGEFVEYEE